MRKEGSCPLFAAYSVAYTPPAIYGTKTPIFLLQVDGSLTSLRPPCYPSFIQVMKERSFGQQFDHPAR